MQEQIYGIAPGNMKGVIFRKLLSEVKTVNFTELTERYNKNSKKVRERDIIIFVIDCILRLAEDNGTGFGRTDGSNYLYTGKYWQPVEDEALRPFLSGCAHCMGVDWTDARYSQFQEALMKQFTSVANQIKTVENNSPRINLQNGTFIFGDNDNKLLPHMANDGFTYVLPFKYDDQATSHLFESYLEKVLPDAACRDLLAEYIGSIFIPSNTLKLEKALLLYGRGANGKSVLFEILNSLLGSTNITNFSLEKLTDTSGYYRARFSNKLLNYASEISKDLDTAIFKQLVSGEPVDARLPYGQPFIMHTYGKLMFNCNELPADVEHTNAYFRRFIIIPFNVTIAPMEQDKTIAQRIIVSELSGVFNWILRGMQRLLANNKLTESEIVAEQVQQYKIESDTVKLFLHELNYKPSDESYELSTPLYQEYKRFCDEDGHRHRVNKKTFRKRLESDQVRIVRHNSGGHKVYLKREPFVQEVLKVDTSEKLF